MNSSSKEYLHSTLNLIANYLLQIIGKEYRVDVDPDTPALWVLRDHFRLVGTKYGCGYPYARYVHAVEVIYSTDMSDSIRKYWLRLKLKCPVFCKLCGDQRYCVSELSHVPRLHPTTQLNQQQMRTIVTGITVFILWSALCTWYYVTRIKGPVGEELPVVEQTTAEMAPSGAEPAPMVNEAEPVKESPGPFTVHHAFDNSAVLPDAAFERYIEQLLSDQAESEDLKLSLVGYTDNIGSEAYNDHLGLRRARSTRDYLVNKGIPARIIDISSGGESRPVATNDTDAGRAQNRRTEITVIE